MNHLIRVLAALMLVCCMTGTVMAAQVESGSVYCFSYEDFGAGDEAVSGICLTRVPDESVGSVLLDSRVLRPGDVLTAEQASRMTFAPAATEADRTAQVSYLPIYPGTVAPEATMTLAIRGRENKPPVAEDSAMETYKNLEVQGTLKVSDPEGQPMSFTVLRQPKRGTVVIGEDGTFTYTPKKNKVGIDSFTYTATDAAGKVSREATVTVTILKPTDSAQYSDTEGRSCRFTAEWMKNTGIFCGENVGGSPCFSPDKAVTQGEFVTMLVKALELPTDEAITYTGFQNVPQWLRPYLAAAVRSGLTEHLDSFCADEPISAQTAAVLLCSALDLEAEDLPALAESEEEFSAELAALDAARAAGFRLEGSTLTRAETADILYLASGLSGTSNRPRIWQ